METKETLFTKKRLLSVLCALLAVGLAIGAMNFAGTAQESGEVQTVYREDTVVRGDLVVGVSESATATLKTHTVSVDIDAVIDTIYVKAGEGVSEGDVIATLDTEELEEELNDLQDDLASAQMELVTAQVNLTSAQLDLQIQELSLQNSYDTTVAQAEVAQTTYDLTIEQLELQVSQARTKVSDLQKEVNTYSKMLANITGDYEDYTNAYEDYASALVARNQAQAAMNSAWNAYQAAQKAFDDAIAAGEGDSDGSLQEAVDDAFWDYQQAEQAYKDAADDYDDAYYNYNDLETDYSDTYGNMTDEQEIRDARSTARDNLTAARLSLAEAETNLALKQLEAEQSLTNTLYDAENADVTYELKVQQLQYSIQARELEIENSQKKIEEIQKKIAEVQKYLADSTILAPCDGLIASINYQEGAEVNAKQTIMTISDSTNAYVYVAVAQDDIGNITLGQEATLELDAFDTITFTGIVDAISTSPARTAGGSASYNVTVLIEGDTANIFEGMTGTCTLITRQEPDVLYISYRSVYEVDGQSYVKVRDGDGEIVETPITTGFSDGRNVAVLEGLQEGQTVLIESQVQAL